MPALSLRRTVPLAIAVPLFVAVGATGLLAFLNGRRTVNNLTQTLTHKVVVHVEESLHDHLETAHTINQINANALRQQALAPAANSPLEQQLWSQIETFPRLSYVYAANARGAFVGSGRNRDGSANLGVAQPSDRQFQTYSTDPLGQRQALVSTTTDYDPRQRPWYTAALAAQQPSWGPIYLWSAPYPNLALPAVQTVPDAAGAPAVVATDISLNSLSNFLRSLQVGKTGQIFVVERSGLLVATSTTEEPFTNDFERVPADESGDPLTQATAEAVLRRYGNFAAVTADERFHFRWRGRRQVVQVYPFADERGLDWLLVAAIPESDLMGPVNMQARVTLALGCLAIAIAIGLGLLAARRALQPLLRLNNAATALKAQQFDPEAIDDLTQRGDEVGEFARVFQSLAATIDAREHSLDEQLHDLRSQLASGGTWQERHSELARLKPYQKQATTVRQVKNLAVDLSALLKRSTYFCNFSEQEMAQLVARGYQRGYAPGEIICREDELGDEFYVILAGSVEIFVAKLGKPLNTFSAGSAFGELSLLLGMPRTATAKARSYATLFVLERQALADLLEQYPQLRDRLAQQVYIHEAELAERRETLRRYNLQDDDVDRHLLAWIRRHLENLFGHS